MRRKPFAVSIAAALLIIAQSTAPQAAPIAVPVRAPVAVEVRASVRVLQPQRIDFREPLSAQGEAPSRASDVQRQRDAAGTVWVEFS